MTWISLVWEMFDDDDTTHFVKSLKLSTQQMWCISCYIYIYIFIHLYISLRHVVLWNCPKFSKIMWLFVWWLFWDSTMVNYHEKRPFGRICLELSKHRRCKSKKGERSVFWYHLKLTQWKNPPGNTQHIPPKGNLGKSSTQKHGYGWGYVIVCRRGHVTVTWGKFALWKDLDINQGMGGMGIKHLSGWWQLNFC